MEKILSKRKRANVDSRGERELGSVNWFHMGNAFVEESRPATPKATDKQVGMKQVVF